MLEVFRFAFCLFVGSLRLSRAFGSTGSMKPWSNSLATSLRPIVLNTTRLYKMTIYDNEPHHFWNWSSGGFLKGSLCMFVQHVICWWLLTVKSHLCKGIFGIVTGSAFFYLLKLAQIAMLTGSATCARAFLQHLKHSPDSTSRGIERLWVVLGLPGLRMSQKCRE